VADENFEGPGDPLAGWTNGVISTDRPVDANLFVRETTTFLGPFGKDLGAPTKTFNIASGTDSVRVKFEFYEFDDWDGDSGALGFGQDKFQVGVNGQLVDLGFFKKEDSESASGVSNNIIWQHTSAYAPTDVGFRNDPDQRHDVILDIPSSYLTSGTLKLEFIAVLNVGIGNESAGIDNLNIISCPLP